MKREPIYAALAERILQLNAEPYLLGIETIGRDWKTWASVTNQPAVFVVPVKEDAVYQQGLPIKWRIHAEIWVYVKSTPSKAGVQVLNPILDALESILTPAVETTPASAFTNTLDGAVFRCTISGPVEISAGFLGDQTVARVPVEILAI